MAGNTRISVALCTFNGEQFLDQQLRSLLVQSVAPFELIVHDDGSTDRTIRILETFAGSAAFAVRIHRNLTHLGAAQNFAAAISGCSGEVVSCCDQDDIWEPDKIEVTARAFARDPQLGFVFSDADMCDLHGRSLGYRLWSSVGFTGKLLEQFNVGRAFEVLLRQNIVTGATLSFASRFRSLILPIESGWMHDGWITLLLSAVAPCVAIDRPLVRYRQHPAQSVGAKRRSLYQQYLNAKKMERTVFTQQANQFEAALTRLQEQTDFVISPRQIDQLQQKIQHCRRRSAIRQREISRVLPSLNELLNLRYRRYSLGWKSFAQDLLL